MSVLIKGGRVITAADDYVADIFIEGERITLIGESLDVAGRQGDRRDRQVRAAGLRRPAHAPRDAVRRQSTIDDFESGHTAAAFGGTTTHVDFCIQGKGQTFAEALAAWHAKREGKALIDNGFHIAVTDLREGGTLEELATLPEKHGVTSYKLFMAYKDSLMVDDETLFRTMQVAAETGALVMVHAENGDAIEVLVSEALAAGNTAPRYHALTRPPEPEGEATNRAIQLARVAGAPLYVVHVSCEESVEPIAPARDEGLGRLGRDLHAVLLHRPPFLDEPGFEGAKYVYTPPPRDKANQEVLWNAVRTDVLSAISTDHCAFLFDGQKTLGQGRLLEDPERRPRAREPAADDPPLRRPRRPDLAQPDGRAARDEPGEALRPLPAQGHARRRLRRRHRRLRPEEEEHDLGRDPPLALRLQPLRGNRGHRSVDVTLLRGKVLVENGELVEPGLGQFVKRAKFGEELV